MHEAVILAAGEGGNPIIPDVWEMLVVAVSFAVLWFIAVKFVVPAFEKVYAQRAEAIEGGIAKAEAAQAEATAALEEYKRQLNDARTEANRIREEARSEGAQILAELKEKAASESARITAQAQTQIDAERQSAAISLRAEVGTLATALAGKIVGESLNDDERSARVVDRFLADLENQDVAEQSAGARQ